MKKPSKRKWPKRANRLMANLLAFPALAAKLTALVLLAATAAAGEYQAKVTRVKDGDTLVADVSLGFGIVLTGQPVRLSNANAPESGTEAGVISRGWLATRIDGATVTLVTGKTERDSFGRILARVLLGGIDIGEQMKAEHVAHGGPGKMDARAEPKIIHK